MCVYVKVREKEDVEYDHVSLKSEKNILFHHTVSNNDYRNHDVRLLFIIIKLFCFSDILRGNLDSL